MRLFTAELIYVNGVFRRDYAVLVDGEGRIQKVVHRSELIHDKEETAHDLHNLDRCALLPGCVNSHSHAFQVYLRGAADQAAGFDDWVDRYLYPLALALDEEAIYASAQLAFYQMMLAGTTTVGEFFYLANDRDGRPAENAGARAVIRAARDVGLRIVLLRSFYDQGAKSGQRRFREKAQDARRLTEMLASEFAHDSGVSVLPAPHSLHGASREAIQAAAELAASWNAPFHIHLAERRSDIDRARDLHGCRPLEALDRMGVLSARTVVVHGCWLAAEERARLAETSAGLVVSPVTNQYLGDGVTDVADLLSRGVHVSLGTDANVRSSLFGEARAAEFLARTGRLSMGVLSRASRIPGPQALLWMATEAGARNLGVSAGVLAPGQWADMVALDLTDPSLAGGERGESAALVNRIVFSMVPESAVRHVFVGGVPVLYDREPVRVERKQVVEAARAHLPSLGATSIR
ncbi:MAG: amidohydrolase family protein [Planctomycetes bacterium]|nr:amidohydrolase family protein [Planctomycetota bacterium]